MTAIKELKIWCEVYGDAEVLSVVVAPDSDVSDLQEATQHHSHVESATRVEDSALGRGRAHAHPRQARVSHAAGVLSCAVAARHPTEGQVATVVTPLASERSTEA